MAKSHSAFPDSILSLCCAVLALDDFRSATIVVAVSLAANAECAASAVVVTLATAASGDRSDLSLSTTSGDTAAGNRSAARMNSSNVGVSLGKSRRRYANDLKLLETHHHSAHGAVYRTSTRKISRIVARIEVV